MSDAQEAALQRAIATISQSDPLIKLLQQVALGKMKPTDAGLRAITDSWLKTYQKVLDAAVLSRPGLARLDPTPRIEVLVQAGVLEASHETVQSLRRSFEQKWTQAAAN